MTMHRLAELCGEREDVIENTNINNRLQRINHLLRLLLLVRVFRKRSMNVNPLRETVEGLSNYYLVVVKFKLKIKTNGRLWHMHRKPDIGELKKGIEW